MYLLRWFQILLKWFWIHLKFKPVILCEIVMPSLLWVGLLQSVKGLNRLTLPLAVFKLGHWFFPTFRLEQKHQLFLALRTMTFGWNIPSALLGLQHATPLQILEWNGHLPQVLEPTAYYNSLSIPTCPHPLVGSISFTGEWYNESQINWGKL